MATAGARSINPYNNVSFTMPTPLLMNQPISDVTSISLTWQASINPGFVAYTVFKSTDANVSTTDQQIDVSVAAANNKYADTVAAGQVFYYRVYEKDLIPEIGSFILVGSNVVSPTFPEIASFSPTGQNVDINSTVQITFAQPVDQNSVTNGFTITSSKSGETVNGSISFSGNTLTFTPSPALKLARTYTVQISGMDTLGDSLTGTLNFSFSTPFPTVASFGPTGNNLAVNTPIQITFAGPVDQAEVASDLSITSTYADNIDIDGIPEDVVNGTTTFAGNTLTFTPVPAWDYARTFNVNLTGVGSLGGQTLTYSFATKTGYLFDAGFASTTLGSQPSIAQNARFASGFIGQPSVSFAMDRSDNVLVVDANLADPAQLFRYASTGALAGTIPVTDPTVTVDTSNNIWGCSNSSTSALNEYTNNGNPTQVVTLSSALGGPHQIAIDAGNSRGYLTAIPLVGNSNFNLELVTLNDGNVSSLLNNGVGNVSVDSQGFVYVSSNVLQQLNSTGSVIATIQDPNGSVFAIAVGTDDTFYYAQQSPQIGAAPDYLIWKLTRSLHLVTHFRISGATLPGVGYLGADSVGRLYINFGNQFIRFIPDP